MILMMIAILLKEEETVQESVLSLSLAKLERGFAQLVVENAVFSVQMALTVLMTPLTIAIPRKEVPTVQVSVESARLEWLQVNVNSVGVSLV